MMNVIYKCHFVYTFADFFLITCSCSDSGKPVGRRQGATAVGKSFFGQGVGPVWMDNIGCQGSEKHLFECQSSSILGVTGCGTNHQYDAGAVCDNWHHYQVRLVNGTGPWEGRVEIHAFGRWWSVSNSNWDERDARVVCNLLGYNNNDALVVHGQGGSGGVFGPNENYYMLDNLNCNGSESHLMQCDSPYAMGVRSTVGLGGQYAAVLCGNRYGTLAKYPIRLVGGSHPYEGRVEVQVNGEWGTVCNDYWDNNEARVVCRQLGFNSTNARAWTNSHFGHGSGHPYLDDMSCTGYESYLLQCSFPRLGIARCSNGADAGVTCQ